MRVFSLVLLLCAATVFAASLEDLKVLPDGMDYNAQWLVPGQEYRFEVKLGYKVRFVEVFWTDNGGNAIGQLFIGGKSCGARNVGTHPYGVPERWYVTTGIANGGEGRIRILNDMVKIYKVNVQYEYPFSPPVQPGNSTVPSEYFDNTGNYFPRGKSVSEALVEANHPDNDRYNWPGWYEPGRDYRFKVEPNKRIRQIKVRWYCEEGNARVRLYINWRYQGTYYAPQGNYPRYDWWYLWETTDDSYWNEGRLEISGEKVYIDSLDVEYDWNYTPPNATKSTPDLVPVIFERIE